MGKTKIKTVEETEKQVTPQKKEETVAPVKAETAKEDKKAKDTKKKTAKVRSKKYQEVIAAVDRSKYYKLNEAITLAQQSSYSKFTGTLEAHINTSLPNVRGLVLMPFAAGKTLRVLAFGKDADSAGADIVGTEETIEEISKGGKIEFDVVAATPEWMPKLAKIARILGPRGLMPNPKSGTVSDDLKKAVDDLKGGKTEYKTEAKAQVIHMVVGKADQSAEEVSANLKALYNAIGRSKIKRMTLSPTMGAGVKVDLGSI